jgi:hypothetical protein
MINEFIACHTRAMKGNSEEKNRSKITTVQFRTTLTLLLALLPDEVLFIIGSAYLVLKADCDFLPNL